MKSLLRALCLAAAFTAGLATAQDRINFDNAKEGEHNIGARFWVGIVGNSECVTTIRLDSITSVSKHCYTVNGVPYKEVTVDTLGNNSIRFYACADSRVGTNRDRMSNTRQLVDQHSGNATSTPAKKFPEGAYSHNIEYQVDSPEDLDRIYESIINALIRNKGCTFRIK